MVGLRSGEWIPATPTSHSSSRACPESATSHAIKPGTPASRYADFAVALDESRRGTALAALTYALQRVLTFDECARVVTYFDRIPPGLATSGRLLQLDAGDRERARARVNPPVLGPFLKPSPLARAPGSSNVVLVVEDDPDVLAVMKQTDLRYEVASGPQSAMMTIVGRQIGAIIISDRFAFGLDGLLARLPLDLASRALVVTRPEHVADARWRLKGEARILATPLEPWVVTSRVDGIIGPPPERAQLLAPRASRKLAVPEGAPFRALLVDPTSDVEPTLRRIIRHDSKIVTVRDVDVAVTLAFAEPFHFLVCSTNAALPPKSLLDAIGREDREGADRIVVIAPPDDLAYTRWSFGRMGRKNLVLPAPVDELSVAREILGAHPALREQLALMELVPDAFAAPRRPRFRRSTLLVVDDRASTEILFAARDVEGSAVDFVLARSQIEAFEILMSRPIDALVVSAAMRSEGSEPFYRVLWRLQPELKASTILVVEGGTAGPLSASGRVVERPLDRATMLRLAERLSS